VSTLTPDGKATATNSAVQRSEADILRIAALALLSIRFIQGFVYRGGGSEAAVRAASSIRPD